MDYRQADQHTLSSDLGIVGIPSQQGRERAGRIKDGIDPERKRNTRGICESLDEVAGTRTVGAR